jgi:serine protease Do
VTKGSPAEKAGLAQGDVIVEFKGHPVEKVGSFRNEVALVPPGTRPNITIIRHGKRQSIAVKIGKLPAGKHAVSMQSDILDKLGLNVETLTRDLAEQLGYQGETGVVVTQVDSESVAALAGIRPGALILEVKRKRVHNIEEFDNAVALTASKGVVLLLVKEGSASPYVTLSLEK